MCYFGVFLVNFGVILGHFVGFLGILGGFCVIFGRIYGVSQDFVWVLWDFGEFRGILRAFWVLLRFFGCFRTFGVGSW